MGDQLDGCWEKRNRAEEQLKALNGEVEIGAGDPTNVVSVVTQLDAKGTHYNLIVVQAWKAPVLRWGVMIGEIVHNLRSALDHLAYQLVLTGRCGTSLPRNRWKDIHFPIYDTKLSFRDQLSKRLPGVGLRQLALIEREQPYKTYHVIERSPLRRLRILSNTDKHRVVTPLLFPVREPVPQIAVPKTHELLRVVWFSRPVEAGTVIAEVHVKPLVPEPKMDVEGKLTTYVAFDDGAGTGLYLDSMLGAVTRILESFWTFFEGGHGLPPSRG